MIQIRVEINELEMRIKNTQNQWPKKSVLWKDKQDRQNHSQTKQERKKIQINKIRDKKGDIKIDINEIQKNIFIYLKTYISLNFKM